MIAHFYPRETSEISKTFDTFSYFLTGQYFFTVGGLWSAYEEMADVLMYYNDVLLCYGIRGEELKEAYTTKFEKNMKRW